MLNLVNTKPAELKFSIAIIRKDTGEVETFDIIGHIIEGKNNLENIEEIKNGINTFSSCT